MQFHSLWYQSSSFSSPYVSAITQLSFPSEHRQDHQMVRKHYMLNFSLFWSVTSADSYSSIKDTYQAFYVISYYLSTKLKFTDMKKEEFKEIAYHLCWIYTGISLIQFKISHKRYPDYYLSIKDKYQTLYVISYCISTTLHILFSIYTGNS